MSWDLPLRPQSARGRSAGLSLMLLQRLILTSGVKNPNSSDKGPSHVRRGMCLHFTASVQHKS